MAATYKQNLVLANLVTRLNHNGKRGDVIHIPVPTRGTASAKAASTQVTLIAATETEKTVNLNKHFEYSRLIEDIVNVQAIASLRAFYTNDAGYALAQRIDRELHILGGTFKGGVLGVAATNYAQAVIGSDGSTLFGTANQTALTDAGLRKMIQTLDDDDVPLTDRYIVIPPVEKKNLTGISRYTEQAFVGEVGMSNTIRTGMIGDVYGHMIYVSSNCPFVHNESGADEAYVNFTAASLNGVVTGNDEFGTPINMTTEGAQGRGCMIGHRSASVLVEQIAIRSQAAYIQEFLGWLYTSDTLFGVGEVRDYAALAFIVPA